MAFVIFFASNYTSARTESTTLSSPVEIQQGILQGIDRGDTVQFLGIPYAQPPVGNLRWKAPEPPSAFDGVFKAVKPGPIALQRSLVSEKIIVGSEDCLYLNVMAPKNATGKALPVMVWIHGGAFIFGDGIQKMGPIDMYDATALVTKGELIVVTMNYRLGPMGFLALPALQRESPDGTTGNYGILDQIAALKWVQKNISAFGGDPSRVTIFGESAGGNSVKTLVASPLAKGLFWAAIGQSAPFMERPLDVAMNSGQRVANSYRKSNSRGYSIPPSLKDLRAIPGDELVRRFPLEMATLNSDPRYMINWAPVVDNFVLKMPILETVRRGLHNKVPFIGGTMAKEMTSLAPLFLSGLPRSLNDADYMKILTVMYGAETAKQAFEKYNRSEYGTNLKAFKVLLGDATFHSPSAEFTAAMESSNPDSVYRYVMSQDIGLIGPTHGADILYLFPGVHLYTTNYHPLFPLQSLLGMPAHKRLSDLIIRMWSRFAHTRNPNAFKRRANGDPYWPTLREGGVMEFDAKGSGVIDEFRADHMEHWAFTTRSNAVNVGARCEALFLQ